MVKHLQLKFKEVDQFPNNYFLLQYDERFLNYYCFH